MKKGLLLPLVLTAAVACATPNKKCSTKIDEELDGTRKDGKAKMGEVLKSDWDWPQEIKDAVKLQHDRDDLAWALSECMRDTIPSVRDDQGNDEYTLETTLPNGLTYGAELDEDTYAMGQGWSKDLTVTREITDRNIKEIIFPAGGATGSISTVRQYQNGKFKKDCNFFGHHGDSDYCSYEDEKNYEAVYGDALVNLLRVCRDRGYENQSITLDTAKKLAQEEKARYSKAAEEAFEIEEEYIKDIEVLLNELEQTVTAYQPVILSELEKENVRFFMGQKLWNKGKRDEEMYKQDPACREIVEKFRSIPDAISYGIYRDNRYRSQWLTLAVRLTKMSRTFTEKKLTTGWFTSEEEESYRKSLAENLSNEEYLQSELREEAGKANKPGPKFLRDPNNPDYLPFWEEIKEEYRKKRQEK